MMASQPPQSTSTSQPPAQVKELTIDDLAELENTLYSVADRCVAFGLQLGVKFPTIQKIQLDHRRVQDQLREILAHRLTQLPHLTWHNIVQALRSNAVQMNDLASEIESQHMCQPPVAASQQVTSTHTHTAPPPSTYHSVSQSAVQPNLSTPSTQPHPSPTPAPHIQVHVPVHDSLYQSPQTLHPQLHPLQYSSPHPPPHPPTSTPSQPQAEAAQPPSSSQPSSSQLMSVPATSQAMPGPSPQLSQDVATPHPLQVGEQQALQGQPPLQHIPSHQPQTVAQSHGTGSDSGPPQAKRSHYKSPRVQSSSPSSASGPSQAKGLCFDLPMAQYIKYVKTLYRQTVVEKKRSAIKWPPTPSTCYINLVCVDRTTDVSKEEADECTRAMVCDGSVDVVLKKKTPINFSDIARNVSDSETLILVEGAPGVGKSTFSLEFCRRWERGEIAQQYQLVLLLRLRDERISKAQSLGDLIYMYHSSDHIHQAVVQELESTQGMNTLIILDGFDELPSSCRTQSSVFMQLIQGELLPDATVLVTSRPWATQIIHDECSDHILQHIEILGFTSGQIEEYVKSVFTGKKGHVEDKARKNIEEVMSYIKTYPQIGASMYIPLNAAIVVSVHKESKAGRCILPRTLTELYSALVQTLLLRYLYGHPEYRQRRWKIQSLKEDLPPDVYSKLLAISELAYSGIYTDPWGSVQLIFTNLPEGFETLGLMQSVPQLYVTQGEDMSHNFLHLTVQEFLAALHISNMSPEKQLEHFQHHRKGGRWRVVLRFLAGITRLANLLPEDLKGLLLEKPYEGYIAACRQQVYPVTPDVVLSSEHVHWMFEAQRDDIVPLVLQERTVEFRCHEELTPLDYYSLGYCIVHSHCWWVLTIGDEIGEEEVRMLVAGANTRRDTSARVVGLRGGERREDDSHRPLSISAEALHTLFSGLENMIHLQELHLILPVECSGVRWPDLSGLRVLHIAISDTRNWRLDTLLPHLLLQSLTIESTSDEGGLGPDDVDCIRELFLSSNCPKHVTVTGQQELCITAEVAVGQHVHDKHFANRSSVVEASKILENRVYHPDWYLMGYVIAHSNFQWMLTMDQWDGDAIREEEVRMLVAGTDTRRDTNARVVGLRSQQRGEEDGGGHWPLLISAEALHTLFSGLENVIHLQELRLTLPEKCTCSSIPWPDLSGLRVLHLGISGERNWRLDTLLPRVSLESFAIEATNKKAITVVLEDQVAIGMLLSSSNCLKCLHFQDLVTIDPQGIEIITKAMSENKYLPLRSVVMECNSTFSDTAAHSLAQFITNTATLHHLSLWGCTFSAHGLLELAQAIHHSSILQKRKLVALTCTVDGDDEATDFAHLLHHYPHMMDWLDWHAYHGIRWSHITDRGAQAIATTLHHNSTLMWLDLSNNNISDTGSTTLAQALHRNSTLKKLDLSGNDTIGEEGTRQLVQALTENTSITIMDLRLPGRCEEYATQCPQYSAVKDRIEFR